MKLSYSLTLDEKLQGGEVLMQKLPYPGARFIMRLLRFSPAFATTAWLALFVQLSSDGFEKADKLDVAIAAVLGVVWTLASFSARFKKAQARKVHGPGPFATVVEATETEFVFSAGTQEGRFGWSGIEWLIDDRAGLAFYFPPGGHCWIPNTAFANKEERAEWRKFIQARVDDAKQLRGAS